MMDMMPKGPEKRSHENGSWSGGPWWPGPLGIALAVAFVIAAVDLTATLRAGPAAAREGVKDGLARARQALEARDFTLARDLLTPLASKGNTEAEVDLGMMSELGEGTAMNIEGAAGWYRKAANSGNAEAASRLGDLYLRGIGVPQDFSKAHHWLDVAANEGVGDAQVRLGRLYEHGWGVDRNPVQAYAWYEMAARQDLNEGITARDRVLNSLSPSDVVAAQAALGRLISTTPVASAVKPPATTAKPTKASEKTTVTPAAS